MKKGKLYGVGVGPGDPELLTIKGLKILKKADVIGIPGKNPSESVAFNIARGAFPGIDQKQLLLLETPMTKDRDVLEIMDKVIKLSKETKEFKINQTSICV